MRNAKKRETDISFIISNAHYPEVCRTAEHAGVKGVGELFVAALNFALDNEGYKMIDVDQCVIKNTENCMIPDGDDAVFTGCLVELQFKDDACDIVKDFVRRSDQGDIYALFYAAQGYIHFINSRPGVTDIASPNAPPPGVSLQ